MNHKARIEYSWNLKKRVVYLIGGLVIASIGAQFFLVGYQNILGHEVISTSMQQKTMGDLSEQELSDLLYFIRFVGFGVSSIGFGLAITLIYLLESKKIIGALKIFVALNVVLTITGQLDIGLYSEFFNQILGSYQVLLQKEIGNISAEKLRSLITMLEFLAVLITVTLTIILAFLVYHKSRG